MIFFINFKSGFLSTLAANIEDIFVSFVITKSENNYGFVLSSQFSPVMSKNYSKFPKFHCNGLKGYLSDKTIFAIT